MKKLMIAAAIVCAAAFAQASSYNWSAATAMVVKPETTTFINGSAYLFDVAAYSQASLLTALRDGTYADVAAAFAAKGVSGAPVQTITSGKGGVSDKFEYDVGAHTFYAVFVDSSVDGVFISSTASATGSEIAGDTATITLANQAIAARAAMKDGDYAGAGWYQTVPEPTSGLLLLLGVAGLALRRRRA